MATLRKTFQELYNELANKLEDSSHNTWSLDRKKDFINQENASLLLLMAEYSDWEGNSTTITTSANTQEYDLPEDFQFIRMAYRKSDNLELYPMPSFNRAIRYGEENNTGEPYAYYLVDSYRVDDGTTSYAKIGFYPVPDGTYTIYVKYYPAPQKLVNDADISPVPGLFHDLIILGAGLRAFEEKGMIDMYRLWERSYLKRKEEFISYLASRQRYKSPFFENIYQTWLNTY